MGKFGNAFQRLRNKIPSTNFVNHKHGECANFDNGTCKAAPRGINLTNLNPKGPACIHFKDKSMTEIEKQKRTDK
ncbi:MAG: hypothetical protein IAX21_03200 [Candidatus Bathyarchaeota archaeon]|nr:MAG: hypothetical protein IAX21_03200 [Candidatus Bathyarchaeota archaeon]